MDEQQFEVIKTSWNEIIGFVQARTRHMSPSARAEYLDFLAFYVGTSRKSIDRWIANGLPSTIKKNVIGTEAIRKLHTYVSRSESGNWRVAEALGGALEMRKQAFGPLEDYRGDYFLYRRGKEGLIEGNIVISNDNDGPWMHYHSSNQNGIEYEHKGPIYLAHGSIYMVGIGATRAEKYFRPMIFKAVDNPRVSVTFGILLTELADTYLPLSAKVALVSSDDPRVGASDFLDELERRLSIDSKDNVIYGAGSTRL